MPTFRVLASLLLAFSAVSAAPPVAASVDPGPSSSSDPSFVTALTTDLLGRAPSAAELSSEASAPLDNAAERARVVESVVRNPDYLHHLIDGQYLQLLHRHADSQGLAYWTIRIDARPDPDVVVDAGLVASDEYAAGPGVGGDHAWVTSLYTNLLGRDGGADAAGATFWAGRVPAAGRASIAAAIAHSAEYNRHVVTATYANLLGHQPDVGGLAFWASRMARAGSTAVTVAIASSPEYLDRARSRWPKTTPPSAPTGVLATPLDASATVTWQAPDRDGGLPIDEYAVSASPGGAACTTTGETSCTVTGLTNGTAYRFIAFAHNSRGWSQPSRWSPPVTPTRLGWSPPTGAIPSHGTVLYLQSDPGDYIGQGRTYRYTLANSVITPDSTGGSANFQIAGDQTWYTTGFGSPMRSTPLTTGYWPGLNRYAFAFVGDGRGCNTSSTDLQIDDVAYDLSGHLTRLTMRFLQHCEETEPPLRGFFRYDASDPTTPPPPGDPADFDWHPPAGGVPSTGNYLYLQGSPGNAITSEPTMLLDASQGTPFSLTNTYGRSNDVSVTATDQWTWNVWMFGQSNADRLVRGLYRNVQRAPFNNPTAGGFSVFGWGGCNTSISTFAVDQISYDPAGHVTSISARFVQRCTFGDGSSGPPVYGALRVG